MVDREFIILGLQLCHLHWGLDMMDGESVCKISCLYARHGGLQGSGGIGPLILTSMLDRTCIKTNTYCKLYHAEGNLRTETDELFVKYS